MKKLLSHPYTQWLRSYVVAHKIISAIVLLGLVGFGYWGVRAITNTSGEARYVMAAVQKGTLVVSITGSGQVSASNQVDLKPKASGDVIYIGVQNGQDVQVGALVAELDARDAEKAVRDATTNLESAKLSLTKLQKPADALSLTQAENALAQAEQSKVNAEADLAKAYDDGFNTIASAFLDLPGIMQGLNDILYSSTVALSSGQKNVSAYADIVKDYDKRVIQYSSDADTKYQAARDVYNKAFDDYKTATRVQDPVALEALLNETYITVKTVAESVKNTNNLIDFVEDRLTEHLLHIPSADAAYQTSLDTYTSKTNSHLSELLSILTTIKNSRDAIENAGRTISEKQESLAKIKNGADPLDLQSQELAVRQKENALLDAQEKLADYFVRAPFAGTIAKLSVKKADSITSGTVVATLITKQKIAEISLNEVDVAKVKVGQKVTLTFDAIDGLSIAGEVLEIDTVGTVTQGVVTYNVKLGFDTQDDRIKPGMSVSAAIITDVKQDVLVVPNSAVKSQGNTHYVEMFDTPLAQDLSTQGVPSVVLPRQQVVEIGLSNDTSTEIISGLKEGDQVVARTITAITATTQQAPSLFGAPGGNRGATGGGAIRARGN